MKGPPVYYPDYIKLDQILDAQFPLSTDSEGKHAHDEMLFIIIHQVYELWFKQILFELGFVQNLFNQESVPDAQIPKVNETLERCLKIIDVLNHQVQIIETMTPQSFLEFRDRLVPASGFQSLQFRKIECLMGINEDMRSPVEKEFFRQRLSPEHLKELQQWEETPSLFKLIEKWLERTPFVADGEFVFQEEYSKSVDKMMEGERELIKSNPHLVGEAKARQIEQMEQTALSFRHLFDEKLYQRGIDQGTRRISQKAAQSALFIMAYQEMPLLYHPFRLLRNLIELDAGLTKWRYAHALLAHKIIGDKLGTGGSSGAHYLKKMAEKNQVFLDLTNLSSFLLPRHLTPALPESILDKLNFTFH